MKTKLIPAVVAAAFAILLGSTVAHSAGQSFDSLVGKWVRPDGGYQLVVKKVEADGKVEAQYLNPAPIHVAEAKAAIAQDKVTLFVKLEDEGYPGSTYNLTLSSDGKKLVGTYFQAEQKLTFEIHFDRK